MTQQRHRGLRRIGVLVAVPALSALTLAACGGGDEDSGAGGSGGSADGFTFAFENASGGQQNPWQLLADEYAQESGVQIETQGLPPDSYGLTMRTQLQGGNAPDVMMFSPGAGNANAVLPLAEAGYIEELGEESAALVPEGNEPLFEIDGKVYAQPTSIIPVGMVWNSSAASSAGVEVPEDEAAMLDACSTLAADGKSFLAIAGSAPPNMGLMAMAISATRVYAETPDWNEQRSAGDVSFADSEGWQATLQTIVDMNDAGCFQQGAAGGGFDAITQGLTQGTSLGAFVPGAAATELANASPGLDLQVQPFPAADGGDPFVLASPNYALSINASADEGAKEAAREFLAWMAEPENAARFVELQGGVAITGPDENLSPVYEPLADLLTNGDYAPLPNLAWPNPGVYDALSTGVQGLLAGQGDVQSVLEGIDQAWDQ
ncbi:raffinose/stachyose/melibiose transport system substrate-binding protein [Geodermatophilus amargosae]|uniref:Raffinose/stachyose/melibiose transport system substrate-binding protein n=1 Tax=Geodermatophilus amargosae TaxID=1296565 RepID=A0A1I6Z6S2_9ACTN|nr:extracellular solute-binding protein [Geodermatophilus amargosae]SFT58101.1 raffinose/stachyose/melibiose transport system substrate-binding protein [Geodermatophilus amargosae]